jgi:hypothetical protein
MNRNKIHKIIIKLITGICLVIYFTTSGIIGIQSVKGVSPNNKYAIECKAQSKDISMLTGKVSGNYATHDWFTIRLNKLAKGYGKKLNIYSGYRSVELQRQLFNQSDKSGKMVAEAGKSRHNVGLAVDVDGWGTELTNEQLEKYGLYKPMSWENWHIEPIETKGKTTEQLMAKYGKPNDINVKYVTKQQESNKELSLGNLIKMLVDKEIERIDEYKANRE